MKLAEFDPVLLEEWDRFLRLFEFYGQVARVIVDTQVFGQPRIVSMLGTHPIEKLSHFASSFKQTQRLGLQPEVELASGLRADARDVFDTAPKVIANDL